MHITSEQLVWWLRSVEHGDGYQPQSYSGRYMYGRRCVGVTVKRGNSMRIGPDIVGAALVDSAYGGRDDITSVDGAVEIANAVSSLMSEARSDSMGLDIIVYWPDMKWDDSLGKDGDEEDDDGEDVEA